MSLQSILSAIASQLPSVGKYLFILVLILNANSLPFVWHIKFWWRLIPRCWLVWTQSRQAYLDNCERRIQRQGGVASRTISKRRAWLDECDHNMHLSNSCYAKNADQTIGTWVWDNLPALFEAGGFSALGGTHYTFIKEIPILSEYTIESRAVGWGEKWIYIVTEYIIYPKRKPSSRPKSAQSTTPGHTTPGTSTLTSGTNTPPDITLPSSDVSHTGARTASPLPDLASHALAALRTPKVRSDGGVVACIAVHEVCLKIGRMTVPPRIGFYMAGHASTPEQRTHARSIGSKKKTAAAWLSGGWKSEPNANDIGRDILPCMTPAPTLGADAEKPIDKASVIKEQCEGVVKGMEEVNLGLGQAVRL